ncbi:curli-like amyloid fiber formation chaperone CsgH [Rhodopseudomonas telluris]|uniref:Curli-like amyloid fiber formation chaperone CsgH n=1 Tax=Rhodopseudomonas telluris TaxID=644215 RepID=A0ABV6ELS6_9BRAD
MDGAWPAIAAVVLGSVFGVPIATGPAAAKAPPAAIACDIRTTTEDGLLRIEAIATAAKPTTGTYRLVVTKSSATGISENHQSGSFELNSDGETVLTTIILDGSARGHYRASLIVESGLGRISCVSP